MDTHGHVSSRKGMHPLIVAAFVVALVGALYMNSTNDSSDTTSNAASSDTAQYNVTASQSSITFTTPDGMEQITDQAGNWARRFDLDSPLALSVVVQDKTGRDDAQVSCEIRVNGEEVKSSKSRGAFAVAQCSGMSH